MRNYWPPDPEICYFWKITIFTQSSWTKNDQPTWVDKIIWKSAWLGQNCGFFKLMAYHSGVKGSFNKKILTQFFA